MSDKPATDRRTLLKLAGFGVGMAAAPFAAAQESHGVHHMPAAAAAQPGATGAASAAASPKSADRPRPRPL